MESPKNFFFVLKKHNLGGLLLRGLSMGGKFLLLITLSKTSSLENVGLYGLFISAIVLVNYLQGMEFHTYSTRELLAALPTNRSKLLFNQFAFYMMVYLFILPLALSIFLAGFLPKALILYFYLIVVAAHLGQEFHRLLIILSRPTLAYLISFFTHGAWTFVAIAYFYFSNVGHINFIFGVWSISALFGVFVGIYGIWKLGYLKHIRISDLDLSWINKGMRTSFKFFVAIVAIKVVEFSDRYFIDYFHGESAVGVYTFYSGFANLAQEFVFIAVISIIFPLMVAKFQNNDLEGFVNLLGRLKKEILWGSSISAFVLVSVTYGVINFLNKPQLSENIGTFYLLLISSLIVNLSMISHFLLYSLSKDKEIMWSAVLAMILNVILNSLLIPQYGILGAAFATMTSFACLAIMKYWLSQQYLQSLEAYEK